MQEILDKETERDNEMKKIEQEVKNFYIEGNFIQIFCCLMNPVPIQMNLEEGLVVHALKKDLLQKENMMEMKKATIVLLWKTILQW